MKKHLEQALIIVFFAIGLSACTKKSTTKEIPADYTTRYSDYQDIVFSRTLVLTGLHAESIKIIKLNGKYHLVAAYADLLGTTYDYFRSFEIDSISGKLNENTLTILGEYKEVGFPKSPFFYEDLNGDGIKDLFEVDHGKETPSLMINGQFPGFENHLFLGTADGRFNRTTISDLTNVKRFHHNASVGDVDNDGDNDLILQYFGNDEMFFFKNTNGLSRDRVLNPGNSTGAVLIADIDGDGGKDILSAPYIDRGSTPTTKVLKLNLTSNGFNSTPLSGVNPFGANYGCYKLLSLSNNTATSKNNIIYFSEGGVGDQKVHRTSDQSLSTLEDLYTKQSTHKSNGIRDFQLVDLNMDGLIDILFTVNPGAETLNQRVWINKGDNTFENPTWEVDATMKDFFILLSQDKSTGRTKFLYYSNSTAVPKTNIVSVYTKKR